MSRLGRIPVVIPAGVQVKVDGQTVEVKGGKGTLTRTVHPEIKVEVKEGKVHFSLAVERENARALWGLNRVLVANMIQGVSQGYRRELEIVGVGYKAELKGKDLQISAGFSRPVVIKAPKGIAYIIDNQTKIPIDGFQVRIAVEGCDKELVGRIASELRRIRQPEPYKGKGLRYAGEHIRRKAGKIAGK
ncbi:MAG: 50S ribosomal protein L6 [Chitinispirillaceae bacterium]|nr:50S ribosomal protein L6 [Chitinispirillaceae bacterium]